MWLCCKVSSSVNDGVVFLQGTHFWSGQKMVKWLLTLTVCSVSFFKRLFIDVDCKVKFAHACFNIEL